MSFSSKSFSILDLAKYAEGSSIADAFTATKVLAQHAESWGYKRYWLAEHHNLEGVASAATAILIGYVAENTKSIRVGSGGIMLPNHSPLVIAEQFGTLATLYPGRIDLGLGRAPGSDQTTMRAIRGDSANLHTDFGDLIEMLMFYFSPAEPGQKLKAIPGAGIDVPIWILGSSLYSAQLAARIGRPYAFAGHFAPREMLAAFHVYRTQFKPSEYLDKPHTMVGVPIVAGETQDDAEFLATTLYQTYLGLVRGKLAPAKPPIQSMEGVWQPHEKAAVQSMTSTLIVGDRAQIKKGLENLIEVTGADELIITSDVFEQKDRLKSYEIIAEVAGIKK